MSVPPETIQVKRIKRTASDRDAQELAEGRDGASRFDGPDYLRLHNPKRVHSDVFIYQRITADPVNSTAASGTHTSNVVPTIHPSKPGEEDASAAKSPKSHPSTSQTIETRPIPKAPSTVEPRRFHFSRPLLTPTSLLTTGSKTGKRSRNNLPTTVFVEHKHKRSRTEDVHMKDVDATSSTAAEEPPPRKLKLPGADRKGPPKPTAQVKKEVAKSEDEKHWAAEDDELSRRMNAFALEIIGQNLAEEEERDRKAAAAATRKATASSPHRFKPKPPVKRFAERHPEVIAKYEASVPPASDQDEYETVSEDEYIVETYVRVPASVLNKDVAPEKIGLLVFGNESDAEFFYGVEGDSDDEWLEDDEDENAENYYTADYPDEDLDSGDEFDRGAYNYRGNASDQEEFDERDDEGYVLEYGNDENDETILPAAHMGLQPPSAFR
ncbi:hypothetical protein N0V82_004275 [Gnomoniopsis sp. IMI 355080]|nr:hypothetical protein N0V82_004275 [Gnomoniopsis sp. IMI 355080]